MTIILSGYAESMGGIQLGIGLKTGNKMDIALGSLAMVTGAYSNIKSLGPTSNVTPINIALGKNVNLQRFAGKTNTNSMHTFDDVIPGFAEAKKADQFENFGEAFDFIGNAVLESKGKFYFNLEFVNITSAKSIPAGTKLMEPLEMLGGKSLWESEMITEWELSTIVNSPSLLRQTNFYRMGRKIPSSWITK